MVGQEVEAKEWLSEALNSDAQLLVDRTPTGNS